jgi:hypothetical protein
MGVVAVGGDSDVLGAVGTEVDVGSPPVQATTRASAISRSTPLKSISLPICLKISATL